MSVVCSQGHINPDGSAFCDECGERLTQTAAASQPAGAPVAMSAPATGAAPTAVATAPRLVIESDNATFDLAGKSEALIGREDPVSNIYPDIDLTPHGGEEGGVSRLHAKIVQTGGQYFVEDQNSTNYTFVNRQKIAPKTPTAIKDGDELRFGRVAVKFHTV